MGLMQAIMLLVQRSRFVVDNPIANWNSGVATSGLAGGDLFTVGTANSWTRLVEASIIIGGLTPGAVITIRAYRTIAGAERLWGGDTYTVGVDPDIIWAWGWWNLELYGTYRCELMSNNVLDDGAAIPFEYRYKTW